jgi:hypothetical protein
MIDKYADSSFVRDESCDCACFSYDDNSACVSDDILFIKSDRNGLNDLQDSSEDDDKGGNNELAEDYGTDSEVDDSEELREITI